MTPEEFSQHVHTLKTNTPAWHRRPTSPGWWVHLICDDPKLYHLSLLNELDVQLWNASKYATRFYGPIPEPPE